MKGNSMKKTYAQTFEDWFYLETNDLNARELVDRLREAGAGFACTSEPGEGRRIYWSGNTADQIVREWHSERITFRKMQSKT
jgi:hypothetical protein